MNQSGTQATFAYGLFQIATPVLANQLYVNATNISSMQSQDALSKTGQERLMIETDSERDTGRELYANSTD